jgi:membrane-bound ClpP family serine protease
VAEGKWIEAGARVRVVQVIGNHVTVREVAPPPATESEAS